MSPTGKGPVHIPNRKGAMQKVWIGAPNQKWPKKMPSTPTLPLLSKNQNSGFFTKKPHCIQKKNPKTLPKPAPKPYNTPSKKTLPKKPPKPYWVCGQTFSQNSGFFL